MHHTTEWLHALQPDPLTGAVTTPIYQTSTFAQEAPGVHKGYDYSRTNNPTRAVLENLIAKLEHGAAGFAFASGLAAIDAVLKLLEAGDEILAVDDVYGGAFRIFTHVYQKFGVTVRYVDTTLVGNVEAALTPRTKLVWLESPTNPTLKISDIAAIAEVAHANGSLLVVDNTFASPALQQPILLGADVVIHSATKYLGGHADLIAGAVVTRSEELGARIKFIQNSSGTILGPWDSWLVIRGIETLPLRVARQSENALRIAQWLEQRPEVKQVFYPGLESHVNHEVAARQQKGGFGGVVSFVLTEDTEAAAVEFCKSTRLFTLAESLGGVKSLACHPASMTHKSIPVAQRRTAGISDGLVRLSVGIEYAEDLVHDLEQAFERVPEANYFTSLVV